MHWCAEETAAVMTFLGGLPFAWRMFKTRAASGWGRLKRLFYRVRPVPHDITSDGNSVWVNGGDGLLGRFGPNGIDVHQPSIDAQAAKGECLHCTHERTSRADWEVFTVKMREHFGIKIPEEHAPTKFVR